MRPLLPALLIVGLVLLSASGTVGATIFSKSYQFKSDVILEIGQSTGDGLRIDSVRFELPAVAGERHVRSGGLVRAEVAVSNGADALRRVGLAVALFDDSGQLVGVASGGSRVMPLKPGRQKVYTLIFDDVNVRVHRSKTFHVTLESKP